MFGEAQGGHAGGRIDVALKLGYELYESIEDGSIALSEIDGCAAFMALKNRDPQILAEDIILAADHVRDLLQTSGNDFIY